MFPRQSRNKPKIKSYCNRSALDLVPPIEFCLNLTDVEIFFKRLISERKLKQFVNSYLLKLEASYYKPLHQPIHQTK